MRKGRIQQAAFAAQSHNDREIDVLSEPGLTPTLNREPADHAGGPLLP
jgi:hypothetical protein